MTTLRWAAAAGCALAAWVALVWMSVGYLSTTDNELVVLFPMFLVVGGVVLVALLLANLNQGFRAFGCAGAGAALLWLVAALTGHDSSFGWLVVWSLGSGTMFVASGVGVLLALLIKGPRRPLDE